MTLTGPELCVPGGQGSLRRWTHIRLLNAGNDTLSFDEKNAYAEKKGRCEGRTAMNEDTSTCSPNRLILELPQ